MPSDLGIVIPSFHPDIPRLRAYVHALDDQLTPKSIRIELDAPIAGVREALSDLPATINAVNERRGKGAAITAGFEALDTDILAFVDADGSTVVDSVEDVVAAIREDQADLAVGSRRHPDGQVIVHQTFLRRHLGDAFVRLARQLLGVPLYDYQCGAKAISAETWAEVRELLYEPGFAWDVELIAIAGALDKRIVEVPVYWVDHPTSTVSPVRDVLQMFRGLVSARYRAELARHSRLHRLLSQYDRNPALVNRVKSDEQFPQLNNVEFE